MLSRANWLASVLLLVGVANAPATAHVTGEHVRYIESLFAQNGLTAARVNLDPRSRLRLAGSYRDDEQVSLAFSLAQSVVGVRWVSPVTPENIQVQAWEKKFGNALERFFSKPKPSVTPTSTEERTPGPIARKYALVVGVGSYRDKRIAPLEFAAKDAQDVYAFLIDQSGGGFQKSDVILLIDENAKKSNVEAALDTIRSKAEPDDLVFVYLGSHGTPPHIFGNVNVVTYDSELQPRHEIWRTSLSDDRIGEFVRGLRAKRLVMILDVCYSNGAYSKVAGFLPSGAKSLVTGDDEATGMSREQMGKRILGAKDLVLEDESLAPQARERDRSGQGWGKVLISASDAGEKSWESKILKNSFFTYFFLDGMRKFGDIKPAFDYARPKTIEAVRVEKDQSQRPQVVADRKDWAIRVTGR